MNISSISSTSSTDYSTTNNDVIEQLEKKKKLLQNELQKINQSKENEKTKQEKIKQIQTQIQLIDAQIKQTNSHNSTKGQNSIQRISEKDVNKTNANEESEANKILKANLCPTGL
jgi:predicted metal-dependent hydrolase